MISADDCGGIQPYMTFATGVRLIVREEDAAKAVSILNKSYGKFDKESLTHRNNKYNSNPLAEGTDEEDTLEISVSDNPAICPKCSYDNSMEMRENANWTKCRKCNTPLDSKTRELFKVANEKDKEDESHEEVLEKDVKNLVYIHLHTYVYMCVSI